MRCLSGAAAALVCALPAIASAQVVLTFDEVVARARAQSTGVLLAQARTAEAGAPGAAAGRLQHNPVIELAAGPRRVPGGTMTDLDVSLSQQLEVSGQRQARTDVAAASVAQAEARASTAAREAIAAATHAFVRAVASTERLRLMEEADAVARELLAATERRFAAGDVAGIDLNLARVEAARAGAGVRVARAAVQRSLGELRVLLRIHDQVTVRGSLEGARPVPALAALQSSALRRPEFDALEAELREANAERRLGQALARPEFGLRASFEREDGDAVVLGGITLTWPAFQRGQSAVAAAAAKQSRARLDLQLGREAAALRVDAAATVYGEQAAAAETLATQALAGLTDNDALARRSYEAGELSLIDLLRLRRDALDTRLTLVELRLAAAESRLDLDLLSGELR